MRIRRFSFPAAFLGTLLLSGLLGAQTVRFAVISDTHVGADGAAAGLRAVVEAVKAQPGLRFVVLDGDLTEKGRDDEFAEFKSIVAGLTVPSYALPGNHDLHWMGFGGEGFRTALGESRFTFQEGGAAFIGMSAGDLGHFAPADLAWLEETARKLPPERDIFLFVHYPPSSIDNWVRARNILVPHRVCVISGHVHSDSLEETAGIPVFTVRAALAGTAGRVSTSSRSDRTRSRPNRSRKESPGRPWAGFQKRDGKTPPPRTPRRRPLLRPGSSGKST